MERPRVRWPLRTGCLCRWCTSRLLVLSLLPSGMWLDSRSHVTVVVGAQDVGPLTRGMTPFSSSRWRNLSTHVETTIRFRCKQRQGELGSVDCGQQVCVVRECCGVVTSRKDTRTRTNLGSLTCSFRFHSHSLPSSSRRNAMFPKSNTSSSSTPSRVRTRTEPVRREGQQRADDNHSATGREAETRR